ncbi:GPO family capsid scaffolding protein [Methylophaga sp.]|uniref:GPO family capsid scaffolding protein n=1 Tax=Methylophaga sp. TaxID=2024840 RepID=UPI0025F61E7F|nr:GPO family capsid scaffolding protein [Methylophaga sp.]
MPSKLKTGWKRIGRSGQTVDGRTIEAEHLRQVAKNYKPDLYKALIWPDHQRWFNMGGVEELRVEDNDEDGVDLYAILSPNEYYLAANRAEQRLFTSMELFPNFRETGEFYLTGLGATDSPASAATSEVRFSRVQEPTVLLSQHIENTTHDFTTDEDSQPGWFTRFLSKLDKSDEADMSKEDLKKIQDGLAALTERFNAAFPAKEKPDTPKPKTPDAADDKSGSEDFAALKTAIESFRERLEKLEGKKPESAAADKATVPAEEFTALKDALAKLTEDFKSALNEQPGTDAGDHVNDGEDLNAYV